MIVGIALFALAAPAAARGGQEQPPEAQEAQALERVALRIVAVEGRAAVVDRGAADGLAVGDRVVFRPRGDRERHGLVVAVEERRATVEIADPTFLAAVGMPGEARVPSGRLVPTPAEPAPGAPAEPGAPAHPPWERAADEWEPGMPLLAKVDSLRPEERAARVSGRWWASGDHTLTNEDDRSDGFYRTGVDVLWENPFGEAGGGGDLHLDLEANHRSVDVPDEDDESSTRLRFERLSYTLGGHRYASSRWEFGRFLQNAVPELGFLDGVEYEERLPGGDRFGASFGLSPEPDEDFETGSDLQIAAHYRWAADESERLTALAAYQKTFHHGDADRDLVVARLDWLPERGWQVRGSASIDLYSSGDEAKGSGAEVTQAYVTAGPRTAGPNGYDLTLRAQRFPEIERDEFLPVTAEQLADDHFERAALRGWAEPARGLRLSGEGGAWQDEDESGGDLELGIGFGEDAPEGTRFDLAAFGVAGDFTTVLGGRVSLAHRAGRGGWELLYELSQHDHQGFDADNDDMLQHRARAAIDLVGEDGWIVSGYAQGVLWNDEDRALSIGFYLQRGF